MYSVINSISWKYVLLNKHLGFHPQSQTLDQHFSVATLGSESRDFFSKFSVIHHFPFKHKSYCSLTLLVEISFLYSRQGKRVKIKF